MWRRELELLWLCMSYYTRIPVPQRTYNEESLSAAFRYFPLVGSVVGVIGAFTYLLSAFLFPHSIAVALTIVTTTLATGAMHEDGFADTFDGFGGGYTRERILAIMRDSSSGVYGVVALILLFGLKYLLLCSLPHDMVPVATIVGHTTARLMPLLLVHYSQYARKDTSKGMHVRHKLSRATLVTAIITALLALFFLPIQAVIGLVPLYASIFLLLKHYVERKIGGFTGDVCGALVVICEIGLYLLLSSTAYLGA